MSRNTKHLYTELAFEDGFALVDESIAREQIRQKRLKRQRARKKARRRALRRRIILMLLVGVVVCSGGLMVYEQVMSHKVVLGNRVYQNPLKYYQIQDNISLDGGDYALSEGYEGLKTAKVIQALGLGNAVGMNGALYTSEVADKVALLLDLHQFILEIIFFNSRHQQKEFITAVSNKHICLSGTALDNVHKCDQHHITGIMAKGIIV